MKTSPAYPTVDANPNFAAIEEAQLAFWKENRTFEKSVEQRPALNADGSSNAYVFYDGPPFANGLPHYGHLLTGYVKDAIARYHTMLGRRVERRFGWDCHGLPAEMGAEKELGISGRAAITQYGIGKFNDYCRSSVMKYTHDWEYYVTRQGRWVDFKNDYKTMDTPYMESCVWAFSELYKKGLIYESMRVMPYSWAAETPVSNFETRIDNATREREDKAAYVRFKLKEKPKGAPEADAYYMVAWTTTPWTLPSNLALAVNREMEYYAATNDQSECFIATRTALDKLAPNIGRKNDEGVWSVTFAKQYSGTDLLNLAYEPLFPYFADTPNAFRVLDGSEFVTDGDGTGIVHMAPGFGEADQKCSEANGIEVVVPVDEKGRFTDAIYDLPRSGAVSITPGKIETARCVLRPFTPDDAERLIALHTNPAISATSNDGVQTEAEVRRDLAQYITHQDERGYSQWAVFTKEGTFIGRCGLTHYAQSTEVPPEASLRCALLPEYWHGGYGQELCRAVMQYGFEQGGVERVAAGTLDNNPRSRVMLDALGFRYIRHVNYPSMAGGYFLITREEFARQNLPLSLKGLVVVPDTRIDPAAIVVSAEDTAKHIAAKDVEKYGLANMRIVRWLKARGALVKDEPVKHNYPHCWRTDTPLIYRAMSSWYVSLNEAVPALGGKSVKQIMAANNQGIHWIPDHVRDGQMGKGIESAPDWSISRNRFWGTPIPIWKSASGKLIVPGSIAEIEKLSGQKVADLHRPMIDDVVITKDGEEYRRIEDVFDCWFESGSMPYAQLHYPFENQKHFEENFPADFITEYIAQTRGWFYTLQVLSAALFGCAPFKNVICHGVVIDDETGLKYSKRLKNYKDPKEVMDAYGADALRWMMLASPVMRGADLAVDPDGKFIRDVVRLNIKPLWSAYNFFTLYANADGIVASRQSSVVSENLLDRYILAKCKAAVSQVRASLDAYDTPGATEAITGFFEVLNNWYIRRSRARFWDEAVTADKQAAYDTLFTVLNVMCIAAAPLLPFTTEAIYRGLNGESQSVHLQDFADVSGIDAAAELVADMDRVRDACTAMAAIRSTENIRNRQPLASATFYGAGADRLRGFADVMMDELNVKEIRFSDSLEGIAEYTLTIDFKVAGKRLGGKMKAVGAAAKSGDWKRQGDAIVVGGEPMEASEYNLQLKPLVAKGAQRLSSNDALVVLDLNITPALEAEGYAKDWVRRIQQARKDAGLDITDRIHLTFEVPEGFKSTLSAHRHYIAEQTLALTVTEGNVVDTGIVALPEKDGPPIFIGITKAA